MFVTFLILLVVALVVVLIWREPELRRRLQSLALRRQGAARAVLGIVQPRDLQRQAIAIVKERALLSIKVAHLPTDVVIFLGDEDYDALGATRDSFVAEVAAQISALTGEDAGGDVRFVLGARPQVRLERRRSVPPGTVEAKLAWQEGTIAVTALQADADTPGPVGGLTLLIEEEGQPPYEVALVGRMSLGRDQASAIRILHPSVSRRHAEMAVRNPDSATITDLGSQNGVEVDGERARPHEEVPVHAGQPIRLSRYVTLRLLADGTEAAPPGERVDADA
ncbi:MAG TPA: FHA domain-containing protein [Solirubrobacterales bacterium]|nr:FHA domain-containing protein [Solirubrobacterales bacterium]